MDIPVISLTYNRPEYLKNVLIEHGRVNSPMPIHIVDDGSDNTEQLKLLAELEKNEKCVVHAEPHLSHRQQVLGLIKLFNSLGYEYIAYTEDDTIFSINWYQYGVATLDKLLKTTPVGALSLYSGHGKLSQKVFGSVFKHTDSEHFYGTCCIFIKTSIANRMEAVMYGSKGANNPDVAIRWLSMHKELNLFVAYPNLAQHEGVNNSMLKAPKHHSSTFYGINKDAMTLL